MLTITWDNTPQIKKYILKLMGKAVRKDGVIIDVASQQPVVDNDDQELSFDTFGMVAKGSEIYVRENIVSVANFLTKRMQQSH